MIRICLNKIDYEYDIRGLLTSFYPGEEIEKNPVLVEEIPDSSFAGDGQPSEGFGEEKSETSVAGRPDRTVYAIYEEDGIRTAYEAGGRISARGKVYVPASDRKATKIALKKELYALFSADTGKELPWGTLTGIRPTKIAMGLLEEGASDEDIRNYMKGQYLTGEKKTSLAIEIAHREKKILSRIDYERGYSLYIGIPFCPTTCFYCSFTSYPLARFEKHVDAYLDCVCKEIDYTAEAFRGRPLNSVYIGGGTPTTLSAEQMDRLLTKVEQTLDLSHLLEFTVEAGRPDSITEEKLRVIKKHRVTRISINPQTMKQKTLDIIGRRHTVEQIVEIYELARTLGFDNINMDIILGLPDETKEDVEHTMKELSRLRPDNLTVHSLAVKRASRLNRQREDYAGYHMENSDAMMQITEDYARGMSMAPYYLYRQKNMAGNLENVGYAMPGKAGIYNILIMEEKQSIVALGAGSTTKAVFPDGRIERADNIKDVLLYMEKIDEMIERKKQLFQF